MPSIASYSSDLSGYKDAVDVDSWAIEAMSYMLKQGITTGTGSGMISPKDDTTRANMAQALSDYCLNKIRGIKIPRVLQLWGFFSMNLVK